MTYPVQNPPPALPVVGQGPAVAPPALPQAGDFGSVRAQLRDVGQRLKQATRLREELVREIRRAGPNEAPILRQQLAATDAELAGLQAQFSQLIGRVAQEGVQPWLSQIMADPPGPQFNFGPPDMIRAGMLLFAIGIILPLTLWAARRWRRKPQPALASRDGEVLTTARLDRLEQAVDTIAIEIERISESQRFIVRILNERMPARTNAAEQKDASLAQGAPLLALGAGPIEPIRVGERQAVKPTITPH